MWSVKIVGYISIYIFRGSVFLMLSLQEEGTQEASPLLNNEYV